MSAASPRTAPDHQLQGYGTTREVAAYTGFSPGTLRNWRWLRKGPPFTGQGNNVRYAWADVERWMRERPRSGLRR